MLTRRRYQRRYSIQKLAGTQLQFYTSLLPAPVPRQRRPWQPGAHLRPAPSPHQALTGTAWDSRYSIRANQLDHLPKRLTDPVVVSVWDAKPTIGKRVWM